MNKKAVLVIGTGRSGTSTLSRGLIALGVEFGAAHKKPSQKNPRGLFEEVHMLAISKMVRRRLGLRAEHVRLLNDRNWRETNLDDLRAKMRKAIDAAMGDAPIWGFKYAGTGRLIPFWLPLLQEMKVRPAFVLAYRNPMSITASRNQLDPYRGRQAKIDLEWLANLVPELHLTKGSPLVIVDYDRMVQEPVVQLRRIAALLDLQPDSASLSDFAENFISPGLRHSQFDNQVLETNQELHPLVRRGAQLLADQAVQDRPATAEFWTEWEKLRVALYEYAPQHALIDDLIDDRRRARWWDLKSPIQRAWKARPLR